MRNLDIQDTRAKLGIYTATGLLGQGSEGSVSLLTGGSGSNSALP